MVRAALHATAETAFKDPLSYFHRYSKLSESEAVATALSICTASTCRT